MRRREFLRRALTGGTVVSMPAFLYGCSVPQPALVAEPLPDDPFLDWFGIDRDVLSRVLRELGNDGGDIGEIFLQHRRHSMLRIDGGALTSARTDILQGAGLRVLRDASPGYSRTEDLSEAGLLTAARQASGRNVPAAVPGLPTLTSRTHDDVYPVATPWSEIDTATKLPLLERVDDAVRRAESTISNVTITWADTDERILIATLDGQLITDRRPMSRLSVQTTMVRDGETQSGFASVAARAGLSYYTEQRLDALVQQALERTRILFDARRPPIGEMPVVLAAGTSGVLLHEAIGHAFEADFVSNGKSPYRDALGSAIADASITIVDQGTLPGERGALNVDDEGVVCRRNVLVEAGRLRGFLHDRQSARAFGVDATGSGRRESYRHTPLPRMTCTFMETGHTSARNWSQRWVVACSPRRSSAAPSISAMVTSNSLRSMAGWWRRAGC